MQLLKKIMPAIILLCLILILSCTEDRATFPRIYPLESYTEVSCPHDKKGYSAKFRIGKDTAAMTVRYSTGLYCPDGKGKNSWYFIGYDEKGRKVDEGGYVDGKQQGQWIGWHQNGVKESEGSFEKGMPVGKFIMWHDNGKIAVEGEYSTDWKFNGKWVYTDARGRTEKIITWDNGTIVSRK